MFFPRRLSESAPDARSDSPSAGAVRLMRNSLQYPYPTAVSGRQKAAPLGESGGAGQSVDVAVLQMTLRRKGLCTEAWTEANFCNVRMRRNRSIPRSRRRNGRCEFSARLLSQRPISRLSPRPRSFSAAPYERRRSVTMTSGLPCRFMDFFKNFSAALRSRVFVTRLSSVNQTQIRGVRRGF